MKVSLRLLPLISAIIITPFIIQKTLAQEAFNGSGGWLELQGANNYASIADNSSLDVGNGPTDDFTIECFFYIADLNGTGAKILISKNSSYSLFLVLSNTAQDKIGFYLYWNSTTYVSTPPYLTDLSIGWHHIAASYDNEYTTSSDALQIFLDGTRVINAVGFDITPGCYNSTFLFVLGGLVNSFVGKIDEVRISDILRYGSTYTVPSTNFSVDGNTRALWHFSESSGATSFSDATANNNTLTGYNGAVVLPVQLTSFTANVVGTRVNLFWSTGTEMDTYGFDIERKSIDNPLQDWVKIGFVHGSGTSQYQHSYSYIDNMLLSGRYVYRIKQIDNDGSFKYSGNEETEILASLNYSLEQNYPNPANPSTTISYSITTRSPVTLYVFNPLGQKVAVLVNAEKEPGIYDATFDATGLASGVYFYRLQAGSFVQTKKLVVMK
jgi:hypothetical protein